MTRDDGVDRRTFLQLSGATLAVVAVSEAAGLARAAASFEVAEKSIAELQAAMAAGVVSAARLVELYLNRIAAYDQAGPRLNAVIDVNPHAVADARALDSERKRRGPRGPLHGIPVLVKDNIQARGLPTTGGSVALGGLVTPDDAFLVRRLREAGCVMLGKVNLHELALGLTTVSSLGGQTLDPYDITRAPGGSSGGSAVAATASFAAFALGTDTSGSIRIPSSHNSIVGLRPTAGLTSRAGIIPFGHTQDTGGPMARTVTDVAVVLDAIAGNDPSDAVTAASIGKMPRTYTSSLTAGGLKGARLGAITEFFGTIPEERDTSDIVRGAIQTMAARGATVIEVAVPDLTRLLGASNLLSQELKFDLRTYLRGVGAPLQSAEDLLVTGLHSTSIQGILEGANANPDTYLASDDYKRRLQARASLGAAIAAVMEANRLDALVYPTVRRIAPLIGGSQGGSNAGLSAQTGFPAISVPAGFTAGGFPVGVELLGRPFSEPALLSLAFDYEQASHVRRPPAATPPLGDRSAARVTIASAQAVPGALRVDVIATGARSVPPSEVPFQASVRLSFDEPTRQLGFEIRLTGSRGDAAGVYLHRRASRQNGGVAYVLAKGGAAASAGTLTLTPVEADALKAGKCYVSVISRKDPRLSARADITLPST